MDSSGNVRLAGLENDRYIISIDPGARRVRITERISGMPADTYAEMRPGEWMAAAQAWAEKTGQLYKQTETSDYMALGRKALGFRWKVLGHGLTKVQADTEGRKWADKGITRQYRVVRVEFTGMGGFDG